MENKFIIQVAFNYALILYEVCVYVIFLLVYTVDSDYDPSMVPKWIKFSSSDAGIEKCFDVNIIDDNVHEDTETFMLTFDTEAQVTLTPTLLYVKIADNDAWRQWNFC